MFQFAFFFVVLAAVLALVGADVLSSEPHQRLGRSLNVDAAPNRFGRRGGFGRGFGRGYGRG